MVPPLRAFWSQWNIKFPLNPAIPYAVKSLLIFPQAVPVTHWRLDETTHTLQLTVSLDATKELIMSNIEDIVAHCHQGTTTKTQSRDYYEKVFKVYDLSQAGHPSTAIAQDLWPQEFKDHQRPYPGKNPILQRVTDYQKVAETLIDSPRKKK